MTTTLNDASPAQAGEDVITEIYYVTRHYRDADNRLSTDHDADEFYLNEADAELAALKLNEATSFDYDGFYRCFVYGVGSATLVASSGVSKTQAQRAKEEALGAHLAAKANERLAANAAARERETLKRKDAAQEHDRIFREECAARGIDPGEPK